MKIDYDHSANTHSVAGASAALALLFADRKPASLLDVGCGKGTWLRAALDSGVADVFGIDGVNIPHEQLLFSPKLFRNLDLTGAIDLGRQFDAVLCLEVGEHLEARFAPALVQTLARHSNRIFFSAACPGQAGQHHVNCQWPAYWQKLFNERGFSCHDEVRWRIWDEKKVEPWYRQNIFEARCAPELAGKEARIRPVVHPGLWQLQLDSTPPAIEEYLRRLEEGTMPALWHLTMPMRALSAKLKRKLKK